MKLKIKQSLLLGIMCSTMFLLTGCIFDVSDVDLLSKPRLPLELEEISQVLKTHFNEDIQLITPLDGDNKKSVQFIDLDQDGESEVVVLHAKESDEYAMKVTVLSKKDDKWRINTDIQGIGYDVNKIAFPDLDGDGVREIVVGWQSGAQLNKGLSVYRHGENGYEEIFKDSYTEFVVGDVDNNKQDELVLVKLSRSEAFAKAKLYTLKDKRLSLMAETYMDGFINEYANVQIGKVNKTSTGIVIDAKVGARSGFTDVFIFRDGMLKNLFFDAKWKVTSATYRQVGRQSSDVNGDGIIEIPTLAAGNTYEPSAVPIPYITIWNQLDSSDKLKPYLNSFDDLEGGYRFTFPARWNNKIGVVQSADTVLFKYYSADSNSEAPTVMEIKQIARKNWDNAKDDYKNRGYLELGKNLDKVYLGKLLSSYDSNIRAMTLTEAECRQLFTIL